MNRCTLLSALLVSVGLTSANYAHAGAITGTSSAAASQYEVTVTKVELCRSATCANPFVLGEATKAFDIASATAGAEVGKFVDLTGIPLFQTWTHVRVTLDTTFVITASDGTCRTNGAGGAARNAFLGATAGAGAGVSTTYELPNQATVRTAPGLGAFQYSTYGITQTDNASTFSMTVALSRPYTCKGELPRIEVQFDTSEAWGYAGGAGCATTSWPQPPTITITAFDP